VAPTARAATPVDALPQAQPRPPAAPAPGGAAAPRAMPAAPEAFRQLMDYASRGEPLMAATLGRGQAREQEGCLLIEIKASGLAGSVCTPENQAKLCALAAELWTGAPPVVLKAVSEEASPPPDRQAEIAAVSGLAEHPTVLEAVEVFEAQVVALNPARQTE
ncbi:MAG: hypothetical protein V1806_04835, partial [Pseudomonadota bacterium]